MQSMAVFVYFFGAIPVIMALASIAIGLMGLVKKRPLVLSHRPLYWFLVAICVVGIILVFVMIFTWGRDSRSPLLCTSLLEAAFFVVMIFALERQMTGYMILGVTEETFRAALIYALNKMNLPYEETISRIELKGTGADLLASVESWSGLARIRIRQREHAHYAGEIVTHMQDYFREKEVRVNNTGFVLWLLTGLVLIPILIFIFKDINF